MPPQQMPKRALESAESGPRMDLTPGSLFSSGQNTSSICTKPVEEARTAILPSIFGMSRPSAPRSSR